ncbi:hypothetical protein DCAR_0727840 [Daucus carota subsp. sativus]|uniref:ATP-dependent DNA helicase n=1 Tax=Daucus carota subsp. sativus TaxID=79200 RepID=A0AAF0XHY6_DAUCS|nr:PREDICTED: uncharacterized protein LOC108194705 [Daucus carota subsp. sativus]WOH08400.1 hypothetical protein DCAR_0727840 [Daucus carota subsp. sativus]
MSQYFKDALALCRSIGHPSLFLTMTCNTKWPEITDMMKHLPGVKASDAPDVIARVFKLKLDQLIELIKKKNYFGRCIGLMHVIEFQKRGLPHAHMLVWLHPNDKPKSPGQIDQLVTTEIPDKDTDPECYEAVRNYMIHGPCGKDFSYSSCMANGKCTRHFLKRYNSNTYFDDCGFPVYKRRNTGAKVKCKGHDLDNRFVVPYNRDLLLRFQCHINIEICNNSRSLKYLFKYCLKGHDTATMMLRKSKGNGNVVSADNKSRQMNEVKNYLDGHYICASEASWRIFGFDIHSRWPSVDRLPIHLPNNKYVSFRTGESLQGVCDRADSRNSKLEAWFVANKMYPEARQYTYQEFPSHFTWLPRECRWKPRQRGEVIGRVSEVHATAGDLLFLRMLLMRRKGVFSFEDIRTIDGIMYPTFKEACGALDPGNLWQLHWQSMVDDIIHKKRKESDDNSLQLSELDIQNYTLAEIEKLLNDVGKSLRDFPTIPFPGEKYFQSDVNRLIAEETNYDVEEMSALHDSNLAKLNVEQRKIYDSVIAKAENNIGGAFFVYGNGGCGKTFLWQTIYAKLRSQRKIVLPVASSGIAVVLLPGGRIAHSRFHIPLKLDNCSTAGINHGSDLAE